MDGSAAMAALGEAQSAARQCKFARIFPMTEAARTIYFHGLPGSPDELGLAGRPVPKNWSAICRSDDHPDHSAEAYFDHLAQRVRDLAGQSSLRLVGFSLGAFAALQVASRVTDIPVSIHLISAAAPLQTGDFLPEMAGRAMFTLAQRSPWLFASLSGAQSVLTRVSAKTTLSALFASAQGQDLPLRGDPQFRMQMAEIIRQGLGAGLHNYMREIAAYVQDWSNLIPDIRHEVTLWHGEEDNWSPPGMAITLGKLLPMVVAVNMLPGQSHYSALLAYLEVHLH